MATSAKLKDYRQAPRKVRLVADLVRGKSAGEAIATLSMLPKRAALPMQKLIQSAVANAKQAGESSPESMIIKTIEVNKGTVLKRFMPRARGSAAQILKKSSHATLTLVPGAGKVKAGRAKKAVTKERAPAA
jgi:large subunit ribosomal protein L22